MMLPVGFKNRTLQWTSVDSPLIKYIHFACICLSGSYFRYLYYPGVNVCSVQVWSQVVPADLLLCGVAPASYPVVACED